MLYLDELRALRIHLAVFVIFLFLMAFGLSHLSEQNLGNPQPMTLITQLHHLEIERPDKDLYSGLGR